jgi:hypothetical protein
MTDPSMHRYELDLDFFPPVPFHDMNDPPNTTKLSSRNLHLKHSARIALCIVPSSRVPAKGVNGSQTHMIYRFLRYFILWSVNSISLKTPKRPERNQADVGFCQKGSSLPPDITKWLLVLTGSCKVWPSSGCLLYHHSYAIFVHLKSVRFANFIHLLAKLLHVFAKVSQVPDKFHRFP